MLTLKVGAIVILLRNINVKEGLCNGSRLIIKELNVNSVRCSIAVGTHRGLEVIIPKVELAPSDSLLPFQLQRYQLPLRLAFAMTINESQGQTFIKIGLDLRKEVFSHGQLHVAFSRCKSFDGVKVNISTTRNVVCKDIL